MSMDDFRNTSMMELFLREAECQSVALTQGLLLLEANPADEAQLKDVMRAAHSLKGAARIIGMDEAARLAHSMEDCFVAAQEGQCRLCPDSIDRLLKAVDFFSRLARSSPGELDAETLRLLDETITEVEAVRKGECRMPNVEGGCSDGGDGTPGRPNAANEPPAEIALTPHGRHGVPSLPSALETDFAEPASSTADSQSALDDRVLRVTAASLNRLLGLAGESLVASRWLTPYVQSLLRLKRRQWKLAKSIEALRDVSEGTLGEQFQHRLAEARLEAEVCLRELTERHAELETYIRHSANLSHRLHTEAVASRMRPFSDCAHSFPRMIRDLGRSLGKEVHLEIAGQSTDVDRDVLEKLESPLTHLLRNAVDHGLESPQERVAAGKPQWGTVRLEARHASGSLMVTVADDGRGVDMERLRQAVMTRKLATPEIAAKLSHDELLEFLFLPAFTMKEEVTQISGRGVGLDVVQTMAKSVGGSVRVSSEQGRGMRFDLHLPLTLSVMRVLLVEVAGEPYGFPLTRIQGALSVPVDRIETLEGREHIEYAGFRMGIVAMAQVFGKAPAAGLNELPVVVLGDRGKRFGVVVDRFLGERQMVVQPLDSRLGKIKDIGAGALMADGSPALIVDTEDIVRSIEALVAAGSLGHLQKAGTSASAVRHKRVLVVDDSLTVRELERKLLADSGYEADVAVDGMDGWNAVRTGDYDLVLTDIDMPRMDGIDLVRLIKKDPRLHALPVMIVSYKDRPEDRNRGLEAGADYYLTKGSFHDEALLNAIADLIGPAEEAENHENRNR